MKIYLATPYSHPEVAVRQERFEVACLHAALLIEAGYFVYSPIAHTHNICLAKNLPTGWDYWRRLDEHFLDWANILVTVKMPGWKESVGVNDEIDYMLKERKVPVLYWDLGTPVASLRLEDLEWG